MNSRESSGKNGDTWADRYEDFYNEQLKTGNPQLREGYETAARILSDVVNPGESVIDVGCGIGWWSTLLAKRGAWVVCLDRLLNMLQKCKKRVGDVKSRVNIIRADCLHLPFLEGVFDGVMVNWVLAYIPISDRKEFLDALKRVVRKGGWLAITDSCNTPFSPYTREQLNELVEKTFGKSVEMVATDYVLTCIAHKV